MMNNLVTQHLRKRNNKKKLHFWQKFGLAFNTVLYSTFAIGYILMCLNPPANQWFGRAVAVLLIWLLVKQTVGTVRVLRANKTALTIEHFLFVVYGAIAFSFLFGIIFAGSELQLANKIPVVSGIFLFFFLNVWLLLSLEKTKKQLKKGQIL